jgi:hypothetical protein
VRIGYPSLQAAVVLITGITAYGQHSSRVSAADTRLTLSIQSVGAINDAREMAKNWVDAFNLGHGGFQERAIQREVDREVKKLEPQIKDALGKSGGKCVLVDVDVAESKSMPEEAMFQYKQVQNVSFIGTEDEAVQNAAAIELNGAFKGPPLEGNMVRSPDSYYLCFLNSIGIANPLVISSAYMRASLKHAVDERIKEIEKERQAASLGEKRRTQHRKPKRS